MVLMHSTVRKYVFLQIYVFCLLIHNCKSVLSPLQPFTNYINSIELQSITADLWWTVDETKKEITFELHMNTTGWIALGISSSGGMRGADIAVTWVDSSGKVTIQDRYASGQMKPVIDTTSEDWFALQGQEKNGWTAIQFKRLLDTCDTMDYPITSGSNHLIFAYGLVDPINGDITYHQNRRGTRTVPLRSYSDPPSRDKFAGLDTIDFHLNNYLVPPVGTYYQGKIYKVPDSLTTKRHAIATEILIDPSNLDIIHHMLLYECDPSAVFDDNNLPEGSRDALANETRLCSANIANSWAVGGDFFMEFPEEAGYPIGSNFPVKYYMVEIHYNNPRLFSGRRDNTGIRFYLSNQLRQYDLGTITFGTTPNPSALVIPPSMAKLNVDSYCPAAFTQNFPASGVTVVSAFPHTHLQGTSVWTKLIRNHTAVKYLFNADTYDFNYQYHNRLPSRIQIYPGDEFATRCVYQSLNKNQATVGGLKTTDEMCLHIFMYFPRVPSMYVCATFNHPLAWRSIMKTSIIPTDKDVEQWALNVTWTMETAVQLQEFYNTALRVLVYGTSGLYNTQLLTSLPTYKDLKTDVCEKLGGD